MEDHVSHVVTKPVDHGRRINGGYVTEGAIVHVVQHGPARYYLYETQCPCLCGQADCLSVMKPTDLEHFMC